MPEPTEAPPELDPTAGRPPCPAPADLRAEMAAFDARAEVGRWDGPRHRMTYRSIGAGPPLVVVPGVASTYRVYALLLNRLAERFRTILIDYPGENPDDGADLRRIGHGDLVSDLFGLFDHLNIGRVFLLGISFGSTVTLAALHREPRRFPKAAVQGGFARRRFTTAERLALTLGRRIPGHLGRLPLHDVVLTLNNRAQFPSLLDDRWEVYLAENARTPIAAMAHRLDLMARLDLLPLLPQIPVEILLLQGNEDRIVPFRHFEELRQGLPNATGLLMPTVGHQPHLTHAELMAQAVGEFFLPCAPEGCPNEGKDGDAANP